MPPRLRTATLTGYAPLCRQLALDPEELATEVGLAVADLEPGDRWIPAAPVARLLELSAARSGVPDFALRLGAFRRLGTLGPLGAVLRDEPDLRGALELLVRYERGYNEAVRLRLTVDDPLVTLTASLQLGEPAPTAQALDLVMTVLVTTVDSLVRPDWRPLTASFGRPTPADPAPWQRCFGPVLRFGQDATRLTFPVRDLDLPVAIADPSLRPYTHEILDSLEPPGADGIAARTAEVLERLLPTGTASADEVGRRLGLTVRQLQRALAQDGETFTRVLNGVRADLAQRRLSAGRTSLTELSLQLGFTAPSALSRWFRQQFGTSPSAWREAAAPDGGTDPHPPAGGELPT